MKSLVNGLLQLAEAIFSDYASAYPSAIRGIERDLYRLTLNSRTRGLAFFTLDLPQLESLLLEGLKTGTLNLQGPLSRAVSKKVRIPRLFRGMWLDVFEPNGKLRSEPNVDSISFLRALCTLGKKLKLECSSDRIRNTVNEYFQIDKRLRSPTLNWDGDFLGSARDCLAVHLRDSLDDPLPLFDEQSERDAGFVGAWDRVQLVADLILTRFSDFEAVSFTGDRHAEGKPSGARHGPGATASTSKLKNKWNFENWSSKLESWFPYEYIGVTPSIFQGNQPRNHEVASRLLAVPKTAKAPRLIAAEPVEHQWCQQIMLCYFNDQFTTHFQGKFIDLFDQSKSARMVRQASVTGRLATVDLSSASDRLSCWVVERIFRKKPMLLQSLHAARTRYVRSGIAGNPEIAKLKKFASQGTAVTFPVQSFVFLCFAIAATLRSKPSWSKISRLRNSVRVYGDDIILPTHGYATLVKLLHHAELKVNEAKSYASGYFRESCGADYYRGYDVTPVKIASLSCKSPAEVQGMIDSSNNFFLKGYWKASEVLRSQIPTWVNKALVVGPDGGRSTQLASFVGYSWDHLTTRWNPDYQRHEIRTYTVKSGSTNCKFEGHFSLIQYLNELPSREVDWESGVRGRPVLRHAVRWEAIPSRD